METNLVTESPPECHVRTSFEDLGRSVWARRERGTGIDQSFLKKKKKSTSEIPLSRDLELLKYRSVGDL